ncbi:MAG: hypothetical protein ABUS51_00875, partial [Acidobacteriota bacterium]
HPAIRYWTAADDPVARLQKKLEAGTAHLDYVDDGRGYLASVLKNLDISPDSQMLVFSKTSFQSPRISPATPRALYFNDNVAVGFVQQGDVLELAALDPKQGEIFYTLDADPSGKPGFARRDVCLQCHSGPATLGIPGILVSSVYPDPGGQPNLAAGDVSTDDRSPIDQRWGGWFVTGKTGAQRHMGNAVARDRARPRELEREGTQNLTSLGRKISTRPYLLPTSDIVALMTLEHQTRMTDLMIRTGWDTRIAEQAGKMDDPATKAKIDGDIEELVTYMLFADEAKLQEPVEGVSTFTRTFSKRGPRDRRGRSLRDFDLRSRLFRYPLSYMIYSEAFDGMPAYNRERIWKRVYDVLTGKEAGGGFGRLSPEDRKAIFEIVRETKRGLPAYWERAGAQGL